MPTNDNNRTAGSAIVGTTNYLYHTDGTVTSELKNCTQKDNNPTYNPCSGMNFSNTDDVCLTVDNKKELYLYQQFYGNSRGYILFYSASKNCGIMTKDSGDTYWHTKGAEHDKIATLSNGLHTFKMHVISDADVAKNVMQIWIDGALVYDGNGVSYLEGEPITGVEFNSGNYNSNVIVSESDITAADVSALFPITAHADIARKTTVTPVRYTNRGISDGPATGTVVDDSSHKYSNTGTAVYNSGGDAVKITDMGFHDGTSELWVRMDMWTHAFSRCPKMLFYFDSNGGNNYIGISGSSVYYGERGAKSCGLDGNLFLADAINKLVIHVSSSNLQIYVNGKEAVNQTGVVNGTKITSMFLMPEIGMDNVVANNNMLSNIIVANHDCSGETLATPIGTLAVTNHYDMATKITNPSYVYYRWDNSGDGSRFDAHAAYKTSNFGAYSRTGIAFNAGDNKPLIKNLPNLNEAWVKFDYYNSGNYRWVQVFFNGNKDIGMHGTDDATFFKFFGKEFAGVDNINTVMMHLSRTMGTAELWINGTQVISGVQTNLTAPITSVAMSPSGWGSNYAANTNNWMSNIIISEAEIGINENAKVTTPQAVTDHCDTYRSTYSADIEHADITRTMTTSATQIPVANHYDTYRTLTLSETEHADISREATIIWRYTNAGKNQNVNYPVKEVACDYSKSVTGTAIANKRWEHLFPIGSSKEIWIKFDAYIKSGTLRIQNDNVDETCGVTLVHKPAGTPDLEYGECSEIFFNGTNIGENAYMDDLTVDGYNRYVLHMKASTGSAKDGIIELYVGNDKKTNHVMDGIASLNKGMDFTHLYFCTDDTTDNVLVSNIIISNRKVGIDEDVLVTANKHYDMHYKATRTEVEHADMRRAASTDAEMDVTFHCDVDRLVRLHTPFDVTTHSDIDRAVAIGMTTHADTYTLKKLAPWRYENAGTYNLLSESYGIDHMAHLNVTDSTGTKTRTGIAYAVQANVGCEMFDIPIDTEIWIKFDAWISPTEIAGTHRQIIAGSSVDRHYTDFDFRVPLGDSCWTANGHNHWLDSLPDITGLHSYKMHILAGDAHGAMEIYIDDETKPYITYTGNLLHTELLDNITIGADIMNDNDMSASLISNVIISNQYIGIHEMVKDVIDHGRPAVSHGDIQRYTSAAVLNHEDISLTDYFKAIKHEDTYRSVSTIEMERADIARRILHDGQIPVIFHCDICRRTSQPFASHADICRATKKHIRPHYDTQAERFRKDRFHYTTHNDIEVKKSNIINYHCDIARNKLLEIKPFREGYQDVQEIDISLNELTLSDSIKLTTTERLYLTEIVRGKLLDYDFQYAIESTSQRGFQTEAQLMQDCDALLYQQIMYNEEQTRTPSYIFDDDDLIGLTDREKQLAREAYEQDILWRKNQWKKDRKERSWAQKNMERISRALDRKLIYLADNFMSSNDWLGTGNTFSSIISALYGWTNRVPRMQINVFMRGDKLYVLQRGHELHLLDLTNSAHTLPEIDREIVRTAWTRTRDDESSGNAAGDYVDGGGIEDYFSGSKTSGGMTYEYADGLLMQAQGTDSHNNSVWILYNYAQADTYGDDAVVMTSKEEHIVSVATGKAMLRQTYYSYGGGWCTAAEYEDGEFVNSSEYQQSPVSRVTEFMPLMPPGSPGGGPGKKATLMVDRSFPVRSDDTVMLAKLTNELMWINRRTKETVKMDVYHCDHLIDFTDRLKFRGNEYYLVSNEVSQTQTELKQSITMVRWY